MGYDIGESEAERDARDYARGRAEAECYYCQQKKSLLKDYHTKFEMWRDKCWALRKIVENYVDTATNLRPDGMTVPEKLLLKEFMEEWDK